jgi:hypothetical protein
MTLLNSVVETARTKAATAETKAALYIPQILDAHRKAEEAEKTGFWRAFDAAVAVGELLNSAKAEVKKGQFKWSDWRDEHIPQIKQSMASLYKDKIKNPDRTTDEGKRINNAVANLVAEGKLGIRNVAALLTKRTRPTPTRLKRSNEDIGKEYLRQLGEAGEVIEVVREVLGVECLRDMTAALVKEFPPPTEQATERDKASAAAGSVVRRSLA